MSTLRSAAPCDCCTIVRLQPLLLNSTRLAQLNDHLIIFRSVVYLPHSGPPDPRLGCGAGHRPLQRRGHGHNRLVRNPRESSAKAWTRIDERLTPRYGQRYSSLVSVGDAERLVLRQGHRVNSSFPPSTSTLLWLPTLGVVDYVQAPLYCCQKKERSKECNWLVVAYY